MTSAEPRHGFRITLDNFEGPFDLLLQLIGRHQLDIAEVALSQVTDEFIAYVKAGGEVWDLEQTSSFLVVAATLLDLKAARLLPSGDVDDPEDLAVLEARDLLFARLLQYRAYKRVSAWFADRMAAECLVHARPGGLEDQFRGLLPEVTIPGGVERLARLAERAFTRAEEPVMPLDQLHIPQVSVAEQADIVIGRLRQSRSMTFRALTGDANRLVTVARFLALLELFRLGQVGFNQLTPLGELRYGTRAAQAELISRWVIEGQQNRLTQASLETLAVIAYSQPVSRSRVSAVRGVNVDGVVRTLLARGLVTESGHDDSTGAGLLSTTDYFLERLGLAAVSDLPPIAPHLPEAADLAAELAALAIIPDDVEETYEARAE